MAQKWAGAKALELAMVKRNLMLGTGGGTRFDGSEERSDARHGQMPLAL